MCEDYGRVATYDGGIAHAPHRFMVDDHYIFETGKPMLVCINTAAMLAESRFSDHFHVTGDRSVHYGAFDCEDSPSNAEHGGRAGNCC